LLNLLYSVKLKQVLLLDVAILGAGYFLRVLYGSLVTGIALSKWMYLTVLCMSFYLGFGKRRNEALHQGAGARAVLKDYTYGFLDKSMHAFFVITLNFYALWAADWSDRIGVSGGYALATVPLVMVICLRYNLLLEKNESGDPTEVILSDCPLLCLSLLTVFVFLGLLYAHNFLN
jgi:4-hydroxybenzoate polyprenyltransferase